jgi:hypothetical protein
MPSGVGVMDRVGDRIIGEGIGEEASGISEVGRGLPAVVGREVVIAGPGISVEVAPINCIDRQEASTMTNNDSNTHLINKSPLFSPIITPVLLVNCSVPYQNVKISWITKLFGAKIWWCREFAVNRNRRDRISGQ